jgi:hypothetical protein
MPYNPILHEDVHGPWDPTTKTFLSDSDPEAAAAEGFTPYDPEGEYPDEEPTPMGLCNDC